MKIRGAGWRTEAGISAAYLRTSVTRSTKKEVRERSDPMFHQPDVALSNQPDVALSSQPHGAQSNQLDGAQSSQPEGVQPKQMACQLDSAQSQQMHNPSYGTQSTQQLIS